MSVKQIDLLDGVYAVIDGQAVRIDCFPFGYEGDAPIESCAVVLREDKKIELFAGPGLVAHKENGRVIHDFAD